MKNKHLTALSYVILAGLVATYIVYYVLFRFMAILEGTSMAQIGALITLLSPVIGPLVGSWLYFKKFQPSQDLWKLSLLYSVIFAVITEIYLYYYEPLWSWSGLIIGCVNGIVLSVVAYRKTR